MDRRTFVRTSVCTSLITGAWFAGAAGGVWPWLAQAAARSNTLAVIDSTLAGGPAFADYAARLALPVFETGDDIGMLWYTTLAPHWQQRHLKLDLNPTPAHAPMSLIGLTRVSDYFVLKELATRAGSMIEQRHEPCAGSGAQAAHVAFALTPRLTR
jgi:hypothetical protein